MSSSTTGLTVLALKMALQVGTEEECSSIADGEPTSPSLPSASDKIYRYFSFDPDSRIEKETEQKKSLRGHAFVDSDSPVAGVAIGT